MSEVQKSVDEIVQIFETFFRSTPFSALGSPFLRFPLDSYTPEIDEFEDSPVDVELETKMIQRLSGFDPESGLAIWLDTGFDPTLIGDEDIDTVREDFPGETYREVVITDETFEIDPLDDPYGEEELNVYEENAILVMRNDELKAEIEALRETISELHNTIEFQDDVKEVAGDLLNAALTGRNETGDKLAELHGIVNGLEQDFNDLTVTEMLEQIIELKQGFDELPLVFNTNGSQFKEVAQALGVVGGFDIEGF
jgi:hypothetical protein